MANLSPERREEQLLSCIENLPHLLNNFSDEVPNHVTRGPGSDSIRTETPKGVYYKNSPKYRSNWWQTLLYSLERIVKSDGISDTELEKEVVDFYKLYYIKIPARRETIDRTYGLEKGDRIPEEIIEETKADVQTANLMIRKILDFLALSF